MQAPRVLVAGAYLPTAQAAQATSAVVLHPEKANCPAAHWPQVCLTPSTQNVEPWVHGTSASRGVPSPTGVV